MIHDRPCRKTDQCPEKGYIRQILKIEFRFKLIENEGISPGRAGETTPEEPIYKCCGKYPNRIPFQFRSSEGEERRCCEGKLVLFLATQTHQLIFKAICNNKIC